MTSLKEKLKHLPPDKIAGSEFITDGIIETGLAEMVVLYGSQACGDYKVDKSEIERWRTEAEKLLAVTMQACKSKI
jgi:hypothetical protein